MASFLVTDASLAQALEPRALQIRSEFLSWVHRLGTTEIDGKTVIEHLDLGDSTSYWWTTLIAEKECRKSRGIADVFKLRALELLFREEDGTDLVYEGENARLAACFQLWSATAGFPFRWKRTEESKARRTWIERSPKWARGLAYLAKKLQQCLVVRKGATPAVPDGSQVIVTYFPNIDLQAAAQGKFVSHYWGGLTERLSQQGSKVRWVWFYDKSKQASYAQSVSLRNELNRAPGNFRHFLVEEFFTALDFPRSLGKFLSLRRRGRKLRGLRQYFHLEGSQVNFYPLLEEDWNDSVFGKVGMQAIFYNQAFSNLARRLASPKPLIYLWESQPWEVLLLANWRNFSRAKAVGVQHATANPLDLRQIQAAEEHLHADRLTARPLPDELAVNGQGAYEVMRDSGYPEHQLKIREALRYGYLRGRYRSQQKELPESDRTLLVITSIQARDVKFQMELLATIIPKQGFQKYRKILFKPHPFLPIDPWFAPFRSIAGARIVTDPLPLALQQADVIYCSSDTGAAVEVAWVGLPIIHAAPCDGFNFHPLYGQQIGFVGKTSDLLAELDSPRRVSVSSNFFELSGKFSGWQDLVD